MERTKKKIIQTNGYLEVLGHVSMDTITRWSFNLSYCLVSILIFGIFFSAGTNKCRVAWYKKIENYTIPCL